jgi:hypothetical protein
VTGTPKADEYQALQAAAHQMLDAADTAARNGDPATEQRAEQAASRLLTAAQHITKATR